MNTDSSPSNPSVHAERTRVRTGPPPGASTAAARKPLVGPHKVMAGDPALITGGFALKSGEVGIVRGSSGEAWVARVDAVIPATPESTMILRLQMGGQISQSLQQDLAEVFQRGLEKEVEFKRDEEAITRFFQGLRPRDAAQ